MILGGLVNCWKSIKVNVMSLWDTKPAFIGFPQSTMSNRKSLFSSSVLPMIMGFSTYLGISCSGAVTLEYVLLLDVTE